MTIKYSVVIPVYNSAKHLASLHKRLSAVMESLGSYSIVYVDDGSSDGSWKLLEKIHGGDKKTRIIQLTRNFGQHNALICGIKHSEGEYIITMDDDLQHPPEEIPKLISAMNESLDVCYARYEKKHHDGLRNLGSKLAMGLLKKLSGSKHMVTSFRVMRRQLADKIVSFQQYNVIIDVLISNVVSSSRVGTCTVRHDRRRQDGSNYSFYRLVVFALDMIFNYTTLPLRLASILGLFFSFVSVLIGVYYLIMFLLGKIGVLGWTSLMLSVTFFSGLILFVLGMIGEYIGRSYLNITKKPQYIIRKVK